MNCAALLLAVSFLVCGLVWAQNSAAPELVLQNGHASTVESVAFSPDGKLIASGSQDHTVKLWDASNGRLIRTYDVREWVNCIAFSPDSKQIASASVYGTVKLWDIASGTLIRTLDGLSTVAFSPTGKLMATGSTDDTIKVWDAATGGLLRTLKGHSAIRSLVFSPDASVIASGGDTAVKLWDATTGTLLRTLQEQSGWSAVAFSPNGKIIASANWDNTVKLWNAGSGRLIRTLYEHSGRVNCIAFSPDSGTIASGSADETIRLWDVASGLSTSTLPHSREIRSLAFHPNGKTIASGIGWQRYMSGEGNNAVNIWDVSSGRSVRTLAGHSGRVSEVAFSGDGKRLASADDRRITLWDLARGRFIRALDGHADWVQSASFSPDGETIASGDSGGTIKIWHATSGRLLRTIEGHSDDWLLVVAFSSDGRIIASGSWDRKTRLGNVKLWNADSGELIRTFSGHSYVVSSVAFSPNNKTVASADGIEPVKLWDAGSGVLIRTLEGKLVAFGRDGKTIATASKSDTIQIWDATTGRLVRTLPSGVISSLAFSTDGDMIAATADDTIQLWDHRNGQLLRTLEGHAAEVTSAAFSPDGKRLASGSNDTSVKLWSIDRGELLVSLVAFRDGNWIVHRPDGYYSSSIGGDKYVGWTVALDNQSVPDVYVASQFSKHFFRPDVIEATLTTQSAAGVSRPGTKAATLRDLTRILPPDVSITSPADGTDSDTATVQLSYEIRLKNDEPLSSIRILINGTPIKGVATPVVSGRIARDSRTISLEAGTANVVAVVASNAYGESTPATTTVTVKPTAAASGDRENRPQAGSTTRTSAGALRPDLYILAVGISEYAREELGLGYAAADAQSIADAFSLVKGKLFKKVEAKVLLDKHANRDAVLDSLDWLSRSPVQGDMALIFVAGHGMKDEQGTFYFLPSDGDPNRLRSSGVLWYEFKRVLDNLPCKVILAVDACHSGDVMGGRRARAADMTELAKEFISAGSGIVVFSSSTGREISVEDDAWKHGAFTKAWLTGLLERQADTDGNGVITVTELQSYVPREVKRLTDGRQHPTVTIPDAIPDFPVYVIE